MTTGWKWIASDGQEFKSQFDARTWARENPDGTVQFSELSMAGVKLTDITEQLRGALKIGDPVKMGHLRGKITGSTTDYWRVYTTSGNNLRHEWWHKPDCERDVGA